MGAGRVVLATSLLLLGGGCSTKTEFAVQPGPALTWHSTRTEEVPAAPDAGVLEARVREAQQPGGDELAAAAALYDLAVARRQEGKLDEAEQLYRQALEICERKQGPDSLDVAAVLNNLAGVEAARGNYTAARPLLERTVSIREHALGEQNVLTAQSMSNLALLYAAEGEVQLAEPLYRRSLAILEKTDRPSQGDLEQVLENYAALLRDAGRDEEAQELEVRVRVIRAARGGEKQ